MIFILISRSQEGLVEKQKIKPEIGKLLPMPAIIREKQLIPKVRRERVEVIN